MNGLIGVEPAIHNLFTMPKVAAAKSPFVFRDYQEADPIAVAALWEQGIRMPCVRWATGLGKSVFIAEMARRLAQAGRVMVIVDVGILAADLVETIRAHTGIAVGVLTGNEKEGWRGRRIVVATVQSLYAVANGERRFDAINPDSFSGLLVDECEGAVAEQYSAVCKHFLSNAALRGCGATATPHRGDKQGLGKIFDWAPDLSQSGELNRSMTWGRDQGWLEPLWHGHLRVSLDFSTLKIRRTASGEQDYSESELTEMLSSEQPLRELAIGIHNAASGEPAVIVCPIKRDGTEEAEVPRALARHLIAVAGSGSAEAVYGSQGQRGGDLLAAYKRGAYPYVCTIKKCEKGFDSDIVKHVFMLRKTKVPRVVEQAAGRAVRPLKAIRDALQNAPDAAARRAIIAASDKPHATFWDMVGLDARLDDASLIDVLAGDADAEVRRKAKQMMIAASQADPQMQIDIEVAMQHAGRAVADDRKTEADRKEAEERRKRSMIQVDAHIEKEISPHGHDRGGGRGQQPAVPYKELFLLRKFKVPETDIARMKPGMAKTLANELITRSRAKLCSYGQAKILKRAGYSKDELHVMGRNQASEAIEAVKANGWKRPKAGAI